MTTQIENPLLKPNTPSPSRQIRREARHKLIGYTVPPPTPAFPNPRKVKKLNRLRYLEALNYIAHAIINEQHNARHASYVALCMVNRK